MQDAADQQQHHTGNEPTVAPPHGSRGPDGQHQQHGREHHGHEQAAVPLPPEGHRITRSLDAACSLRVEALPVEAGGVRWAKTFVAENARPCIGLKAVGRARHAEAVSIGIQCTPAVGDLR